MNSTFMKKEIMNLQVGPNSSNMREKWEYACRK